VEVLDTLALLPVLQDQPARILTLGTLNASERQPPLLRRFEIFRQPCAEGSDSKVFCRYVSRRIKISISKTNFQHLPVICSNAFVDLA
jgi:hypothetical protein